jgi:hypothetical protein
MSGFIFDAKAARAAIAARGPNVAAAAVSAVVAVEGGAMARKPQEPQEPHGKPFRTAIAQPQEPQQPQGASIPTRAAPADEIEERAALAADCVPTVYLDAWARLQCQMPMRVSDAEWRQAIHDAGSIPRPMGKPCHGIGMDGGRAFRCSAYRRHMRPRLVPQRPAGAQASGRNMPRLAMELGSMRG